MFYMLSHTKKENGKIVFNRIAKVYEELGGNRRDIDYQITPMYQAGNNLYTGTKS